MLVPLTTKYGNQGHLNSEIFDFKLRSAWHQVFKVKLEQKQKVKKQSSNFGAVVNQRTVAQK